MISEGYPAIISYHNPSRPLYLYKNLNDAIAVNQRGAGVNPIESHYMTIIGYYKYYKENSNHYSYILRVVSWGKEYFINYDEYRENISYINNVLEIK